MRSSYKPAEKREAKILLKSMNQKTVAQSLGVTEKTVGRWAKEFKEEEDALKLQISHIDVLTKEVKEIKELLLRHYSTK